MQLNYLKEEKQVGKLYMWEDTLIKSKDKNLLNY